jgi:cytochrome c oxidase cbb3-type subunit 4
MDTGTLQGVGTILAMAAFIGICVWAWSSKNKASFDEAAQLPFADDQTEPKQEPNQDQSQDKTSDAQPGTEAEQKVERGTGYE